MKNEIKLLDCTLRDGGYINDWEFGTSTILCVFDRLVNAGVDAIEIGFLDERRPYDPNRTIQPDTACYDKIFSGCDKGNAMVVAMIDYGTCGIEHIGPCEDSFIDGIRIIFKKPKMKAAIDFARQVKEKGYKVFLQMVSITSYSDRDILDLVDMVNEVEPYALSMVDTYGLMHKEEMFHYFHLLERNLKSTIGIGYHSHNNFQLGYSNEVEMLRKVKNRSVVVDGTMYGMGKSAGNAPLELLAMYLNENYDGHYVIDQILEVIEVNILPIYKEHYWGYSLLFFLAASNDCHPNYISYLLEKHTLSVKAINDIASSICKEKRLDFDKSYIEQLYTQYQQKTVSEGPGMEGLSRALSGRQILLLGPGTSLQTQEKIIEEYIEKDHPVIMSVNCIPQNIKPDYVFISNAKRFSQMYRAFSGLNGQCKIIATSNVSSVDKPFDFVLSYEDLRDENTVIEDNAFIMILKAMVLMKLKNVALAGFDGYSAERNKNYFDKYMDFKADYAQLQKINDAVKGKLTQLKDVISTKFLTDSLYKE